MLFEIEFFRRTKEAPAGLAVRRAKVDLIDHEAAKVIGLRN